MPGRLITVFILFLALVLGSGIMLYRWLPIQQQISKGTFGRDPRMPDLPVTGAPIAKCVVENDTHNFGEMEQMTTQSHTFIIKNGGAAPLLLTEGDASCTCTLSNVAKDPIPPGGSAEVTLEWKATADAGTYRQHAVIFTNDPGKQTVRLNIEGTIVNSLRLDPHEWILSDIKSNVPQSKDFTIISDRIDDLTITKTEFPRDKRGLFSIEFEPMPADQLPKGARSGVKGKVKLEKGITVGKFRQKVILHTNSPGRPPLEMNVEGRAYGDIVIAGSKFDQAKSALLLGIFPSEEGAKEKVIITVRGPKASEVNFEAKHATDGLKLDFGEKNVASDELVTIPLTVSVPPGTPAMNYWGTQRAPIGSVVLDSGVPEIGALRLVVQFIVEGSATGD